MSRRKERRDALFSFMGDRIRVRRDFFPGLGPDDFNAIQGNRSARKLLFAMLEDEVGSSLIRDILKWIVENPEKFAALIQLILGLFV